MHTRDSLFSTEIAYAAETGDGAAAGVEPEQPTAGQAETQGDVPRLSATAALLGEIVWLLGRSEAHKHIFLTELDWMVMPPIPLRQFRIWRQNNQPVAYASWAFLSDEADKRFTEGAEAGRISRVNPSEWKSGDNLWLVDFIAPFGGGDAMVQELREKVFPDRKIKSIQRKPDGSGIAVVEL